MNEAWAGGARRELWSGGLGPQQVIPAFAHGVEFLLSVSSH